MILANIKLSEMNSELSKAQEHAHRFQDMLATERRKQKALQVMNRMCAHTHTYIHIIIHIHIFVFFFFVKKQTKAYIIHLHTH